MRSNWSNPVGDAHFCTTRPLSSRSIVLTILKHDFLTERVVSLDRRGRVVKEKHMNVANNLKMPSGLLVVRWGLVEFLKQRELVLDPERCSNLGREGLHSLH